MKNLQRVSSSIEKFTTCQIVEQNYYNVSAFALKVYEPVRFSIKTTFDSQILKGCCLTLYFKIIY